MMYFKYDFFIYNYLEIKKSIANAPRVLLLAESPKYTYRSITNCEKGWFVGHLRRKLKKKLLKFHRKKSSKWPIVSFIHNGSEITTWMGYNFRTKSTKSQATFLKNLFLNFKLQIILLAQGYWSCTPTH